MRWIANPILPLILLATLALSACSGADLMDLDAEHLVAVQVSHTGTPLLNGSSLSTVQSDGSKQFQTDHGTIITLSTASINIGHMHLFAGTDPLNCNEERASEADLEFAEDLLSQDASSQIGAIATASDDTFCGYEIHMDASSAIDASAPLSAHFVGEWATSNNSGNFDIQIADDIAIRKPFVIADETGFTRHTLTLADTSEYQVLTVTSLYDRYFDHIDFLADSDAIKSQLIANIIKSTQINIGESSASVSETHTHDHTH